MEGMVIAALSQATSWPNAKRAMTSMTNVYGSPFAYALIEQGGMEKLVDTLRPGGMQNRKAKILMRLLRDVKARHPQGLWDLQHLFAMSDEDVVKEVVSYWGVGPKSAHCLLSICFHRDRFAVGTHCFRLAGLWGWLPPKARIADAQVHLDARLRANLKYTLQYQIIFHENECRCCQGRGNCDLKKCGFWTRFEVPPGACPRMEDGVL